MENQDSLPIKWQLGLWNRNQTCLWNGNTSWKHLGESHSKNIDSLQNANAADPCSRITDKEFTALLNFHHDPKQDLYNMFCQVPDHLENMVSVQSIPNQLSFIKWVQGWYQQNLPAWSIIECPLDLHFVKERVDHFIRGLCNPYQKGILTGIQICFGDSLL